MTPKERRDRLFKNGKPLVRKLELLNGEGYSKDTGVLWAAYKSGSFNLPQELSHQDFVHTIEELLSRYDKVWIVDDGNRNFSSHRGQVCIVFTNQINMIVDTEFGYFKWATKRNILRATAAFLNMIKNSSKTGICLVRTPVEKRGLCDHLKHYDLLYYVGRTAENEYLYSIRGRGS